MINNDDTARFISSETMGLAGTGPDASMTDLLKDKRDFKDARRQFGSRLQSNASTDVADLRSYISATEYANTMATYDEGWVTRQYTDTRGFTEEVKRLQDVLKERDAILAKGGSFDLPSGKYVFSNHEGAQTPAIVRDSYDANAGKYTIETYGTADSFYRSYSREAAASSVSFTGAGSTRSRDMGMNFYADEMTSNVLSTLSGWTGNQDVRFRFDDVAYRDPSNIGLTRGILEWAGVDTDKGFLGGAYALGNDGITLITDLGRALNPWVDAKILGVDNGMFLGRESKMKQALHREDVSYMDWAASVVENYDELAVLEETPEGDKSPALAPLIRRYGREEVKNLLTTTKNHDALVYGLNRLGAQQRMAAYTADSAITWALQAKLLGHGVVTDPTMAIDIGVGMGLMAAGSITGAAPVAALGSALSTARGSARVVSIISKARKIKRTVSEVKGIKTLNPVLGKAGLYVEKTGAVLVNARRVLPSQVFSELVFPTMSWMRSTRPASAGRLKTLLKSDKIQDRSGAATYLTQKAKNKAAKKAAKESNADKVSAFEGWKDYILNDVSLGQSLPGRAWTRAWQNGLESGIQGFTDYFVMHNQEKDLLEALHGPEAAAELQIDPAGLALMTGAGLLMGGIMGSSMGMGFDFVGSLNYGAITRKMSNKFKAGDTSARAEAAQMFHDYKVVKRKQDIVKKLDARGLSVDETELDLILSSKLSAMESQGLDVDYGIKQATRQLKKTEDGAVDMDALAADIRKYGEMRRRAFEETTGIPRQANLDATESLLNRTKLNLTKSQMDEIEASSKEDHGPGTLDGTPTERQTELQTKHTEAVEKRDSLQKTVDQINKDLENKAPTSGGTRGDNKAGRVLNKEQRQNLLDKSVELSEANRVVNEIEAEMSDIQTTALIDNIAGREMDYLKRLYHLSNEDVDNRLSVTGEGTRGDLPMGNIWAIIEGKGENGTVSTRVMSERFTSEELDSTVLSNGKTVREALDEKPNMTPRQAAELVEEARDLIKKDILLSDITQEMLELERLGRLLGDDAAARLQIQEMKVQAAIAAQLRDPISGEVETDGLSSQARSTILKDLPREGQSAVERKRQLKQGLDKQRGEMERVAIIRRQAASKVLAATQAELKAAKEGGATGEEIQKIAKRINDLKTEIRKGVTSEWTTRRNNAMMSLLKERDVMLRTAEEHVGPLMTFINRLRYSASMHSVPLQARDGSIRFVVSRKQILGLLDAEYRFLINTLDEARVDGSPDAFDLHTVMTLVAKRVATVDGDMATLIRVGAGMEADAMMKEDGLDAVADTEKFMTALIEADRVRAINEFNSDESRGLYAGKMTKDDWESRFLKRFYEKGRRLMKSGHGQAHLRAVAEVYDIDIPEGDLSQADLYNVALAIYRAGGALEEFSQLGGGNNAISFRTPKEAAEIVLESLESAKRNDTALDDEGRYELVETERGVKGRDVRESAQPDLEAAAKKREKAQDRDQRVKRLGNISESLQRRLYEQVRTNDRIKHLLFDEEGNQRSDEDLDLIYDWLKGLEQDARDGKLDLDTESAGRSSGGKVVRLAPNELISRADQTLADGVDRYIDAVVDNLMKNPPAFLSTIHDHIDVAIDGMFGALRNIGPGSGVTDTGFATGQGIFGAAFGFRTMNAGKGTVNDSINLAWELTMGVDGLVPMARQNYRDSLVPFVNDMLEDAGLAKIADETDDVELLGAIAVLWETGNKKRLAELFFPKAKDLDADAEGANILMANMRLDEFMAAVRSGDLKAGMDAESRGYLKRDEGFDPEKEIDLYTIVQKLVKRDLSEPITIKRLAAEAAGKEASPGVVKAWTDALTLWSRILNSENEALSSTFRKYLFKSPVMTDLYQIGVVKMAEDIEQKFLSGSLPAEARQELDRLLQDLDYDTTGEVKSTLTRNTARKSFAMKMAHLLHSNQEFIEGSKIKQGVFGDPNMTTKKIGEAILRVRRQEMGDATHNPTAILNSPTYLDTIARKQLGLGIEGTPLSKEDKVKLMTRKMLLQRAAQEHATPGAMANGRYGALETQFTKLEEVAAKAQEGLEGDEAMDAAVKALDAERAGNAQRAQAYQALANQNFHIDEAKAKLILEVMHGKHVADALFKDLEPLQRQAMATGYFRDLSISAEGRIFVNTVLDMIGDKSRRAESGDNPLGTTKFFNADGRGMDKTTARRAAIMQLAVDAAQLTGDMPSFSKTAPKFEDTTLDEFLTRWSQLDDITEGAMSLGGAGQAGSGGFRAPVETLLDRSGTLDGLSPEQRAEYIDQAVEHFDKLRKNALSGRADNAYGDEAGVVRMGPWGMVDPRYNYNYKESVGIPLARRIQMAPELNVLRDPKDLRAVADYSGRGTTAMFTPEEMTNIPDVSDMAFAPAMLGALDRQLTAAMDFGVGRAAAMKYRVTLLKRTLEDFVDTSGSKELRKSLKEGRYDDIYAVYKETLAFKAEYEDLGNRSSGDISNLDAYGNALVHGIDGGENTAAFRGQSVRFRARARGRREFNRTAQWSRDLTRSTKDLLRISPDTPELELGGGTYEANLALTAAAGNVRGDMMPWLFKPSDQSVLLARSGEIGYKENYDSSRLPLFAQISDSQLLVATALTESRVWHAVVDGLDLKEPLTPERYRQIRAAFEYSRGARDINTSKFDDDIAALFATPERTKQTWQIFSDKVDEVQLDLKSTSFVGDLGATGEGRMLFNAQFTEPELDAIKKSLQSQGKSWADFENEVFTKTMETETGQTPTAFVNMFGEVINPHEVMGQVRMSMTADMRTRALNNSKNRDLRNRQVLGAALGLDRIHFNQELSSRMAGYQGEFGSPLQKVRRQAAEESEALEALMELTGNKKKMRTDGMVQSLSSNRRFVNLDVYETSSMLASAQQNAAMYGVRDASFAPLNDNAEVQPKWEAIRDKVADGDEAMQIAVLTVNLKGELSREGYFGLLSLDNEGGNPAAVMAKVDKIMEAVDEVRSYINARADESPANVEATVSASENATAVYKTTNLNDAQQSAHRGVSEILMDPKLSEEQKSELLNKLNREADPANRQKPGPSAQDIINDPTLDARGMDDGRLHNKLLRLPDSPSQSKQQLNRVLARLEQDGTISKQDRLLLDATFHGMDDSFSDQVFANVDIRTSDDPYAPAGEFAAASSVDGVVRRITVAKDLHSRMNGNDAKFGAAGVVMEEVGHMVDLHMQATNSKLWGQSINSYMSHFGNRMDPQLKKLFGEIDETVSVSEGLARGYAAIMLARGAQSLEMSLRNADANIKQWFGVAHTRSLAAIRGMRENKLMREFEDKHYSVIASHLRDVKPIDLELRTGEFLRAEGHDSIDNAWRAQHDDAASRMTPSNQHAEIVAANKADDGTNRLDAAKLRRSYPNNQNIIDALSSDEIMAQLEVIGSGSEVTTNMGKWIADKIDKVSVGWGRKFLHNARAWSQPASTLAQFQDSAYGMTGNMTTIMRGLASIMSPTETMSMAGFSTLNGGRVPTLTGIQGEIRGRWDAVMETMLLLQNGDTELNRVSTSPESFNYSIMASLRDGDGEVHLQQLSETDREIAREVIKDIRKVMKMTSDDMVEAGMITPAEKSNWENGMPIRLKPEAYNGDGAPEFRAALTRHIADKMKDSDIFDDQVLNFMTARDGEMVWNGAPTDIIDKVALDRWREMGMHKFADKVERIMDELANSTSELKKAPTFGYVLPLLKKEIRSTNQLDADFVTSYRNAITGEITNPLAVQRAQEFVKSMDGEVVEFSLGYAGLRAKRSAARLGDSGYVLYSDPYLSADGLMADSAFDSLIETNVIKVLDGIMRGPAAQALDRAVYGTAFGVKGMGIEDITHMLQRMVKNSSNGKTYETIDKVTGAGGQAPSTLDADSKKMMLAQLGHFEMAIKYSKGTMSRSDLEAQDTPFFKMLNDVMSLSTTAMVGPRYFLGALLEEVPMSTLKGWGEMLSGLRGHVDGIMSSANGRAGRREALRGISTFVRDLQHDSAMQTRLTGTDSDQFLDDHAPQRVLQRLNSTLQQYTGLGFREMTQRIKASDVKGSVSRMRTLMTDPEDGLSMFDGLVRISNRYDLGRLDESEDLNEVLRTLGFQDTEVAGVREMLRMGIFDGTTSAATKRLFKDFATEGNLFNFDKAGEFIQSTQVKDSERAIYMTAMSNIRLMLSIDSIRNSKGPTVADAAIQGSALAQIMTRLTSYASMVSGSLRRQAIGSASTAVVQSMLYMISGYLYFRATQMARGKSFEDAVVGQWRDNPEVELYDMIMSVPFLGYSQMPLAFLFKQVGMNAILGMDQFGVENGKAYSVASIAVLNRQLELMSTFPSTVRGIATGDVDNVYKATTDLASGTPMAFNWIFAPMMGNMAESWSDSKHGTPTPESIRENPEAAAAWYLRQVLNGDGDSIGDLDLDAHQKRAEVARLQATQKRDYASLAAHGAANAARAANATGAPPSAVPTPTPQRESADNPLDSLESFRAAPGTLK